MTSGNQKLKKAQEEIDALKQIKRNAERLVGEADQFVQRLHEIKDAEEQITLL